MSDILTLGSLSLDLSEVSQILDEGSHVLVYFHERHHPPQLSVTGPEANLLREWCTEQKRMSTPAASAEILADPRLQQLPRVWCDFNTIGWSGEPDDSCIYIFDQTILDFIISADKFTVFTFMEDDAANQMITGCEAILERYRDGWRLRPNPTTWYSGPRFW
jgi:hypothetical protein